jgi:hypothetical protein
MEVFIVTLESCEIRNLTSDEIRAEWDYRYIERLGMMCGASEPTREQIAQAAVCADHVVLF